MEGFGTDFWNNVQPQGSLVNSTNITDETGKVLNPATSEEIKYAPDKLVTGELPEDANITKAIVEGYQDGVMIAGAWYLGPASSVGKVIGGSVRDAVANGSYQWFNMSQSGNEGKSYDYLGIGSSAIMGGLAPGRGVWQNVGIAAGGAVFTDGPDKGAASGAIIGAGVGGAIGLWGPSLLDPVLGGASGLASDVFGAAGSEYIGNKVKTKINEKK